jgi:hypothetical protein
MHSKNDYREILRVARLIAIGDHGMFSVFSQLPTAGAGPAVFIRSVAREAGLAGVDEQ